MRRYVGHASLSFLLATFLAAGAVACGTSKAPKKSASEAAEDEEEGEEDVNAAAKPQPKTETAAKPALNVATDPCKPTTAMANSAGTTATTAIKLLDDQDALALADPWQPTVGTTNGAGSTTTTATTTTASAGVTNPPATTTVAPVPGCPGQTPAVNTTSIGGGITTSTGATTQTGLPTPSMQPTNGSNRRGGLSSGLCALPILPDFLKSSLCSK